MTLAEIILLKTHFLNIAMPILTNIAMLYFTEDNMVSLFKKVSIKKIKKSYSNHILLIPRIVDDLLIGHYILSVHTV